MLDPTTITHFKGAIELAKLAVPSAKAARRFGWPVLRAPFAWLRSRRWRHANEATIKRLGVVAAAAKDYGVASKPYEARLILCNNAKQVMAITDGAPGTFAPWVLDLPLGEGGPWTTKKLCEALVCRESIPVVVCNDFCGRYVTADGDPTHTASKTDPIAFEAVYTLCVCLAAQRFIPYGGKDAPS